MTDESERFAARAARDVRREVLIEPLAELGLVAFDGPNDPEPSLVIEDGRVVELDGRAEADWDVLDHFLAAVEFDRVHERAHRRPRHQDGGRSHL